MQPLLEQLQVHPSRIVFANPAKPVTHIQYAAKHHVSLMTFDNIDELYKIKESYPEAELILRIFTDNSKAYSNVSAKFGAHMESVDGLLMKARELELPVVGVRYVEWFNIIEACVGKDADYCVGSFIIIIASISGPVVWMHRPLPMHSLVLAVYLIKQPAWDTT